jgi:hypothetical protein
MNDYLNELCNKAMKLNSYVLILLIIFFGKIIGSFTVI